MTTARSRRPRSLVLAPTRELVNQIAERLAPLAEARGLWITAVYGGVSMLRQIQNLRAGVEIVVATPGRMNDLLERGEVSLADIELVVIDEADQMADMGFLPQVERILGQIDGHVQTLLFSATLDGAIGALVRRYQQDPVHHEIAAPTATVDTLEQRFLRVYADEKVEVTAQVCAGAARAIVFVKTTHGADRLARHLEQQGLSTEAMHGRMSQNKRERALDLFRTGKQPVLVATNVAARGIDVSEIDVVIHYDPPEDEKTYLHRSGRTARAGADGIAISLCSQDERPYLRDIEKLIRMAIPASGQADPASQSTHRPPQHPRKEHERSGEIGRAHV